jgi:hypothetical protein
MRSKCKYSLLVLTVLVACGDPSDEPEEACRGPGAEWVAVDGGVLAAGDVAEPQSQETRLCVEVEW